jgi:hypothetical protein
MATNASVLTCGLWLQAQVTVDGATRDRILEVRQSYKQVS